MIQNSTLGYIFRRNEDSLSETSILLCYYSAVYKRQEMETPVYKMMNGQNKATHTPQNNTYSLKE